MPGFTLTLRFTGVNAYLYPSRAGDPFTVVMPNGTKLGKSPQRDHLARHLPVLLGLERVPTRKPYVIEPDEEKHLLQTVRYLFWQRLTIRAYSASDDGLVQDTSFYSKNRIATDKFLPIPASSVSVLPPTEKVVSQVRLFAGEAGPEGPCKYRWNNRESLVDQEALVSTLKVEIEDLRLVTLDFSGFFGGGESIALERDTSLLIGNLCAENAFGWPANERTTPFVDGDFEWMYVLADPKKCARSGPPPLPEVYEKDPCGFAANEEISALPELLAQQFDGDLGGGGCGCECGGCGARLVE